MGCAVFSNGFRRRNSFPGSVAVLVLAVLTTGCGVIAEPAGGRMPDVVDRPLPSPLTPAPTPVSTPAGDGDMAYKSYPTSTGGAFTITEIHQTTLRTGESFYGFAASGEKQYLLIKRTVSGAVSWFDLYRRTSPTVEWAAICSFLNDGAFGYGRIQVDTQYLWVLGTLPAESSSTGLRRFELSSCNETTAPKYSGAKSIHGQFGLVGTSPYLQHYDATLGYHLAKYSLPMLIAQSTVGRTKIGLYTSDRGPGMAISGTTAWKFDDCSGDSIFCLWKTDLVGGRALGWAELPTSDYSDFERWRGYLAEPMAHMAGQSENIVWLAVNAPNIIRLYRFDLSMF